jgi:hypothetical protein
VPAGPEHLPAGAFEQAVVGDQADRRRRVQQPSHDQAAHRQAELVGLPAGGSKEAVRASVMPAPGQPGTGEHPGDGARTRLGEEPAHQRLEGAEGRGGEAGTQRLEQVGKRAR